MDTERLCSGAQVRGPFLTLSNSLPWTRAGKKSLFQTSYVLSKILRSLHRRILTLQKMCSEFVSPSDLHIEAESSVCVAVVGDPGFWGGEVTLRMGCIFTKETSKRSRTPSSMWGSIKKITF